ncbi:MAG: hypothetical protein KDD47_09545, partial [Acidobacteria bacterium]|nr:hypothetical protein [Acidobacteriota bacterium]
MKVLLVTSRYPWPPRRGDQVRAVQFSEFLGPEHEVTLLAPEPGSGLPPPPSELRVETYRRSRIPRSSALLGVLDGSLPLQSLLFSQSDLGRKLRELAPRMDLVILQLVRLA